MTKSERVTWGPVVELAPSDPPVTLLDTHQSWLTGQAHAVNSVLLIRGDRSTQTVQHVCKRTSDDLWGIHSKQITKSILYLNYWSMGQIWGHILPVLPCC